MIWRSADLVMDVALYQQQYVVTLANDWFQAFQSGMLPQVYEIKDLAVHSPFAKQQLSLEGEDHMKSQSGA